MIIGYLILINVIGYIIMGLDKSRAKNGSWRISEKTLWMVALIGGAVGTWLGMRSFRHKTKHVTFKYGLPLLSIVELGLIIYFYLKIAK